MDFASLPDNGRASEEISRPANELRSRAMPAVKHDLSKLNPESAKQNIIWIASYPKSGNTWVRVFIHNLIRELKGETEGVQDINDLGRYAIWEHSYPHYTKVLSKSPADATSEEIARARPLVQALISSEQPGLSLAKTHLCFGTEHEVPTINLSVTLGAIYVVQNPLDVAISYAYHCGRSIDATIGDMARPGFRTFPSRNHVGDVLGSWSQHVASWIGISSRPIHVVRYEDMLTNPKDVFSGIAEFLGFRPSLEQLNRSIEKSAFSELSQQEARNGFVEKPASSARFFRAGNSGQWRDSLHAEQVSRVLQEHEPMMQRLRYMKPRVTNFGVDKTV